MGEERRKTENLVLRELIDALKNFIRARDALWTLTIFDRLFRLKKWQEAIVEYDKASESVRNAISTMRDLNEAKPAEDHVKCKTSTGNIITMDEFEMLLGKREFVKKLPR